MAVVVGIDIGGSTSRARLVAEGRLVARSYAGSASIAAVGMRAARTELERLAADLGGPSPDAVCAGAAGAGSVATRCRLERLLGDLFPGARIAVVADASLVLPAAGRDTGVALVAGTGSIAHGVAPDGRTARSGGWGYLIGDPGSGHWLVREAVALVLHSADKDRPLGPLAEALLASTGRRDPMDMAHALHRLRGPAPWARMAPAVLEAARVDDDARDLLRRGAAALAAMAATTAARLAVEGPVVLAGGLLESALYARETRKAVARTLPGAEIVALGEPPVAGAVRLAEALAAGPGR